MEVFIRIYVGLEIYTRKSYEAYTTWTQLPFRLLSNGMQHKEEFFRQMAINKRSEWFSARVC